MSWLKTVEIPDQQTIKAVFLGCNVGFLLSQYWHAILNLCPSYSYMDLIIGIFGKIFGVLLLLGIIGWLLDFLRAIAGLARGESF